MPEQELEGEVELSDKELFDQSFDEDEHTEEDEDKQEGSEPSKSEEENDENVELEDNVRDEEDTATEGEEEDVSDENESDDVTPNQDVEDDFSDPEKNKARLNSLNGRFKAEKGKLEEQNSGLSKENAELKRQLEEAQNSRTNEEVKEEPTEENPVEETPEVDEKYEEEMAIFNENYEDIAKPVRMMFDKGFKQYQEKLPSVVQDILEPIIPAINALVDDYNFRRQDNYQASVKTVHEDYDALKDSDEFKEWMSQQAPFMQDSFKASVEGNNSDDAIYVLNLYKNDIKKNTGENSVNSESPTNDDKNKPAPTEKKPITGITKPKKKELTASATAKADLLEATTTKKTPSTQAVLSGGQDDSMSFADAFDSR